MAEGLQARLGRRRVVLPVILILSVALAWAYDAFVNRSILVEANTGTLRVTLAQDMEMKALQGAFLCRRLPPEEVDISQTEAPLGCRARSHELIMPDGDDAVVHLALPLGTEVQLFSEPGRVSFNVLSVPETATESPAAELVGGGVTLQGKAIERFGSLALFGPAIIGAAPVEVDRLPVVDGTYQINGTTLSGLLLARVMTSEQQVLRQGDLRSGALMHFRDRGESGATILGRKAAVARLQVSIPDPASSIFRVTAISDYRPVDLVLLYFQTDPVVVRSSFFDMLAADPVLLLIATLGSAFAILQIRMASRRGRIASRR